MSKKIKKVSAWDQFKVWFNSLPTPVQIMYYVGSSALITTLVSDLEVLDYVWVKYAVVICTVLLNVIQYQLLKLKSE
jgi:hypothetical protein